MPAASPKLDLLAASAATGAKVLSWAVAAAVVYRQLGEAAFAVLAMTRATLGLLNYTTFGIGPALTRMVAEADRDVDDPASRGTTCRRPCCLEGTGASGSPSEPRLREPQTTDDDGHSDGDAGVLGYADAEAAAGNRSLAASLLKVVRILLLILSAFAIPSLLIYSLAFATVHEVPAGFRSPLDEVRVFAFCLGLGLLVRLAGDAVAGASQGTGRVAPDQAWAAAGDVLFAALLLGHLAIGDKAKLDNVGICFLVSGIIAYLGRSHVSKASVGYHAPSGDPASFVERVWRRSPSFSPSAARRLLAYGGLVTLGSAADFLYAPIDYFILNRLVDPLAPAVYAPAVQVDAAILVLVSAVAIVALPSAARLAAVGNLGGVWRGYVKGSLLAGGAAVAIAIPAWWLSPQLYTLWLGDDLPATRAILPLVLVHTVLGSAAGVGRATLVALGRAKAYAVVVLLGGLLNVGLSLWFVSLGLGITGVVLGTVGSVAARCLVALPWLVWSATRERKPTG